MVTFNRLLGLGLGAGLILFAVQNWSYSVPLILLGRISLALPLSVWVLGAMGCGVVTALMLMGLFQADAKRPTERWTAPNEPAPRRSPPSQRWNQEPRDRAGSPPSEPRSTKRDRTSRASQRASQTWGETWDTPWQRSPESWESWEAWQSGVPKSDRREPLVTDAEVISSTAEPSATSRQSSYDEPLESRDYGRPTYTYVTPDPELDQQVQESAVWDDWQTNDDEPRVAYTEPGYEDLDDEISDLDNDVYNDREEDSLYDDPYQDASQNVSVYDDPRFDDYDRDRAAAWQAWRDRHADDPDVDDLDRADSDADDDLEDWEDWDGYDDQESDRPDEVAPSIYEVQREPVRRQQSGTLYSYSYRNAEETAPESPLDPSSESSDTVLQVDVADTDGARVLIPPYSSADDDDPPPQT